MSAHACSPPSPSVTNRRPPDTATGTSLQRAPLKHWSGPLIVPRPKAPMPASPQQKAAPVEVRPQVRITDADTSENVIPPIPIGA